MTVYHIVLSANIEKMFRQVLVSNEQRDLERIVWRENKNEPLGIFQLITVTYDLKPATYLTTRCIKEALDFKTKYPPASQLLIEDTYIDDFSSGCHSIEEAISLLGSN